MNSAPHLTDEGDDPTGTSPTRTDMTSVPDVWYVIRTREDLPGGVRYLARTCAGSDLYGAPKARRPDREDAWTSHARDAWPFPASRLAAVCLEAMPADYRDALEVRRVIVTTEAV